MVNKNSPQHQVLSITEFNKKNAAESNAKVLSLVPNREEKTVEMVSVDDLSISASVRRTTGGGTSSFDGNKFFGGLGLPQSVFVDHWALRAHSAKLFRENIYGRGIIRRLISNEINTGLHLESMPVSELIGLTDEAKITWSDTVEVRFQLWGEKPSVCDFKGQSTFAELQRTCRREALISGDILVVMNHPKNTRIPQVQLVPGEKVQTPIGSTVRKGNKIVQGVEIDKDGRQVAFWVRRKDGLKGKRIPAFGERSGRRIAWLVYGTDRRVDSVRGEPLLSIVLQSIKELDRYRDAVLRKAVINSIIAMSVEKNEDSPSAKPVAGGAVRKDELEVTDGDGATRELTFNGMIPGLTVEELQKGEKLVAHESASTNLDYGAFESSIVHAMAWCYEMPPEILTLSFQNNYSASRGAVMEWKMYLDKSRAERADEFCKPVYIEWLTSEILRGDISAQGYLSAWRDPSQYDIFGAWTATDWTGAIKPNVDLAKEVKGYTGMVDNGFITRARATRELTGTRYARNIKALAKENAELAAAVRPILELKAEFDPAEVDEVLGAVAGAEGITAVAEAVAEILAEEKPDA